MRFDLAIIACGAAASMAKYNPGTGEFEVHEISGYSSYSRGNHTCILASNKLPTPTRDADTQHDARTRGSESSSSSLRSWIETNSGRSADWVP